jgi:hypothetical protein
MYNGYRSTRKLAQAQPSHRLETQTLTFLLPLRSGYDFGYLLKLVSCTALPATESEFFELLRIWFPCIWDIKVSTLPRRWQVYRNC